MNIEKEISRHFNVLNLFIAALTVASESISRIQKDTTLLGNSTRSTAMILHKFFPFQRFVVLVN